MHVVRFSSGRKYLVLTLIHTSIMETLIHKISSAGLAQHAVEYVNIFFTEAFNAAQNLKGTAIINY